MKHVIDHPKDSNAQRVSETYARIDGNRMPRPQTKELQRRSRAPQAGTRLKHFTRIERQDGN